MSRRVGVVDGIVETICVAVQAVRLVGYWVLWVRGRPSKKTTIKNLDVVGLGYGRAKCSPVRELSCGLKYGHSAWGRL